QANAKFEVAASIETANFGPPTTGISFERQIKTEIYGLEADEARVAALWETLQNKLKTYEVILGKQKFLMGDKLTRCYHLSFAARLVDIGYQPSETPNLKRWWSDVSNRLSW
ncbi:hypothetical protein M422DRAFT_197216, partial [Sphaerobolus stellatus SS14]